MDYHPQVGEQVHVHARDAYGDQVDRFITQFQSDTPEVWDVESVDPEYDVQLGTGHVGHQGPIYHLRGTTNGLPRQLAGYWLAPAN